MRPRQYAQAIIKAWGPVESRKALSAVPPEYRSLVLAHVARAGINRVARRVKGFDSQLLNVSDRRALKSARETAGLQRALEETGTGSGSRVLGVAVPVTPPLSLMSETF